MKRGVSQSPEQSDATNIVFLSRAGRLRPGRRVVESAYKFTGWVAAATVGRVG